MAGSFVVVGSAAGLASGAKTVGPLSIIGASVVGEILDVALAAGDNTILVPPGAVAVMIEPPTSNAVALRVRTNLDLSDTGLPIGPADPFGPWSFRGLGVTSIVINAASSMAGTVTELTFI